RRGAGSLSPIWRRCPRFEPQHRAAALAPTGRSAPPARDIFIDILCQHVERDVAALDDDIVEIAQIIFRAECRLRTPALADDFAVADLVSARLARPAAIAVDLACNFERVRSVALDEEADAFLAWPAFCVEPRVDDEAACPERQRLEIAEPPDLEIIVEPKLVGELFGVERPAFGIGVEREHRADQRHLIGIFALPDMPRNRLMHRKIRQ